MTDKARSAYVFEYMLDNPEISPQINNAVYTDKYIDGIRAKWIAEEIIRRMEGGEEMTLAEFHRSLPEPRLCYRYLLTILNYSPEDKDRTSAKYSKSLFDLIKLKGASVKVMKAFNTAMLKDLAKVVNRMNPNYHREVYPLVKRHCRQFFNHFYSPSRTGDGTYKLELRAHKKKRDDNYENYVINVNFHTFADMALFMFGYSIGYKMGLIREMKKWEHLALEEYRKRNESK